MVVEGKVYFTPVNAFCILELNPAAQIVRHVATEPDDKTSLRFGLPGLLLGLPMVGISPTSSMIPKRTTTSGSCRSEKG